MKNNKFLKIFFKCISLLIISVLIGFILMVGVYSIPTERVFSNVKKSYSVYSDEKIETWTGNPRYAKIDNGTDRLMVSEAICRPYDSIIDNALLNPHYYDEESGTQAILLALNNKEASYSEYGRYWHGYLVYIIPGLLFFDIGELRVIFMIVEFLLAIILVVELDKYKRVYAYLFGIVALLINPITAALSFQIADIYIIMMIFSIVILKFNKWLLNNNRYLLLFMFDGICVAYFDYLTYPLVAWGIPIILMLLINKFNIKKSIKQIILCSVLWCFGYAGMWFGKWILATFMTDVNVIEDGISKFMLDSLNSDTTVFDLSYSNTLFRVRETFDTPMVALLLLGFVIIVIDVITHRRKLKVNKDYLFNVVPLLIIGLAPFVWYYVVRYHSCSHIYMEYRQIVITIFVIYLCIDRAFE